MLQRGPTHLSAPRPECISGGFVAGVPLEEWMKGFKLPGLWGIIAANPGADSASSLLRDGIALEEPGVEGGFPFRMRLSPFKSAEGLLPSSAGFPSSRGDTPGAAFPQQPEAQGVRGSPSAAPGSSAAARSRPRLCPWGEGCIAHSANQGYGADTRSPAALPRSLPPRPVSLLIGR